MREEHFKKVVEDFAEGIVIMDEFRIIYYINQKAHLITGWKVGESVPYCSYCQLREVSEHEERCILANDNALPSFRSHIPNYVDTETDFEMSMNKIEIDGGTYRVLIIRNPSQMNQIEKVKTQELLIHETMLAQESERKRIARELHDHIGQSVYSIYLGLDGIKRHVDSPEYTERLEKMNVVMEDTLQCLKRLTKELRPQLYDNLGFESALRSSVEDWRHFYNIQVSLNIHLPNELKFANDEGLHLYRIIQEAVNNAVRHGKATALIIDIYKVDKDIYFQISNNGLAFDLERMSGTGLGIKHMKERVNMLNGDIKWISTEDGANRVEGYIVLKGND